MLDLLSKYSLGEIVVFLVLLGIASKELVTFVDWASDRLKRAFKKETSNEQAFNEVKKEIQDLSAQLKASTETFTKYIEANTQQQGEMREAIQILMDSDKDDIKSWITSQHHYFCYEKGFIDDYSLDCIEKRFKHYQDEGGNSYAEDLMKDLRALPKVSMCVNNPGHALKHQDEI